MARPRISKSIINQIENIWAENQQPTAAMVYILAKPKVQGCPSLRKVQEIVREAKERAQVVQEDPPLDPWGPGWPKHPEDIRFLFDLLYCAALTGMSVNNRQARWALNLRGLFDNRGLDDKDRVIQTAMCLLWASLYANRERAAEVLGQGPPYTADLDGVMMFRIWESTEHEERYIKEATAKRIIPWGSQEDLDEFRRLRRTLECKITSSNTAPTSQGEAL